MSNIGQEKQAVPDVTKFELILNDINESTGELGSALNSISAALHRIYDTNVPTVESSKETMPNRDDLVGQLQYHAGNLMSLRRQAIDLSRKLSELI